MSEQASLNTLVGTFSAVTTTTTSPHFFNTNNMICIDTSENRIGINTLDPSYSIDISGGGIRTESLFLKNFDTSNITQENSFTIGSPYTGQVVVDQSGYLRLIPISQ
tara:strand:+ start:1868 stop:2188 length:321 start_codon:yes stop_codon:yes gene_type:complete